MEKYVSEMTKAQTLLDEVEHDESLQEQEALIKTREAMSAILSSGSEHITLTRELWEAAQAAVQARIEKSQGNSGEWSDVQHDIYEAMKDTMTRELSPRETLEMLEDNMKPLKENNPKVYYSQYADRCEDNLGRIVSCVMYMKEAEENFASIKQQIKELGEKEPALSEWCNKLLSAEKTTLQDTLPGIEALKN